MKEKQLPYVPIFVNDYIAGTRSMTLAERGAYWDLLLFEWARGGPLPNDRKQLAKLLGVPLRQFVEAWQGVREKFDKVPGGLANARLERERQVGLAKLEMWSKRGAAGAVKRWEKHNASSMKSDASSMQGADASSMPQAMHKQWPPSPSPSKNPSQPFPPPEAGGRKGSRSNGTNPRALGANPRAIQNRTLAAWRTVTTLIDEVNGSPHTWQHVTDTLLDPIADEAIEATGGHRVIADRTTQNVKELRARFREAYQRQLRSETNPET